MKHLSSEELLARTKNLVAEERRSTLALIEHLQEIQDRRLYAELGYASLWEFATRYLGLSEGAAQRRIQAMRLTRDVPEAKVALESGRLSLSNAAKVLSFRQAERKQGRRHDAPRLLTELTDCSQKECEKKLFELSPEAMPRERERVISEQEDRELKVVVSAGLHEKLQRHRGLLAHSHPDASYAELLEVMADEMLERLEKKNGTRLDAQAASTAAAAVKPPVAGKRAYLPIALRRAVWSRGGGRCEYRAESGLRCSSRHFLQIDHATPLARGGSNALGNLRLLCRNHNLQQAQEAGLR
jgi:hypothetical protein